MAKAVVTTENRETVFSGSPEVSVRKVTRAALNTMGTKEEREEEEIEQVLLPKNLSISKDKNGHQAVWVKRPALLLQFHAGKPVVVVDILLSAPNYKTKEVCNVGDKFSFIYNGHKKKQRKD